MIGNKAFVVVAVTVTLGVLGATSATASDRSDRGRDRYGSVVPCSLDGVNPVYHPEIFGNPAAASAYGFVRSRDLGRCGPVVIASAFPAHAGSGLNLVAARSADHRCRPNLCSARVSSPLERSIETRGRVAFAPTLTRLAR